MATATAEVWIFSFCIGIGRSFVQMKSQDKARAGEELTRWIEKQAKKSRVARNRSNPKWN